MGTEEVLYCYNFNLVTYVKKGNFKVLSDSEAEVAIQICDSMEPEPKEMFSAPQHCLKLCIYMGLSSFRF